MGCCSTGKSNAPVIYGKVLPVSGKYDPPDKCRQIVEEIVKEQVAEIEDSISDIEGRVETLEGLGLVKKDGLLCCRYREEEEDE